MPKSDIQPRYIIHFGSHEHVIHVQISMSMIHGIYIYIYEYIATVYKNRDILKQVTMTNTNHQ